jgi:plasmid stabilization system protein ParE
MDGEVSIGMRAAFRNCWVPTTRKRAAGSAKLRNFNDFRRLPTQRSREESMPRGDKSKYTDKQERQADHIAAGYEKRGVSETEAERRAWATVNAESGGGKKSGSGRGKRESHAASAKGARKSQASRTHAERSATAKKAAATRERNAGRHAH